MKWSAGKCGVILPARHRPRSGTTQFLLEAQNISRVTSPLYLGVELSLMETGTEKALSQIKGERGILILLQKNRYISSRMSANSLNYSYQTFSRPVYDYGFPFLNLDRAVTLATAKTSSSLSNHVTRDTYRRCMPQTGRPAKTGAASWNAVAEYHSLTALTSLRDQNVVPRM